MGSGQLVSEIQALRDNVREAEKKVARFRESSHLFLDQNNGSLARRQLSELQGELTRAKAERSAAVAKAAEVKALITSSNSIDVVPEVISSSLVQRLVERRIQLNTEIANLSDALLDNHPRVISRRSQLLALSQDIREKSVTVLRALEQVAESASLREIALATEVDRLRVSLVNTEDAEIEIRAMEREAAAMRALLEAYLIQHRQVASRSERNYLPFSVRIFARATPPARSYFPKRLPIIGGTLISALILVFLVILLQELYSRHYNHETSRQVARPLKNGASNPLFNSIPPTTANEWPWN